MRRLPVAAFVALAVATVAAFFVTQHLKVTTPLIAGTPIPFPGSINPVDGRVCRVRSPRGTEERISFKRMAISFYLLHRPDDVDVYIVDPAGTTVRTLASDQPMRVRRRRLFYWFGRERNGSVAPDGTYYIRVSLIHQVRSILISNQAGVAEPVTVDTLAPHPSVTSVTPDLIPGSGAKVTIRYTGSLGLPGRILIYRTGFANAPRLVKSYASRRAASSVWDGKIGGRPAPPGAYVVALEVTDNACNTGRSPIAGTAAHAGVTVR